MYRGNKTKVDRQTRKRIVSSDITNPGPRSRRCRCRHPRHPNNHPNNRTNNRQKILPNARPVICPRFKNHQEKSNRVPLLCPTQARRSSMRYLQRPSHRRDPPPITHRHILRYYDAYRRFTRTTLRKIPHSSPRWRIIYYRNAL